MNFRNWKELLEEAQQQIDELSEQIDELERKLFEAEIRNEDLTEVIEAELKNSEHLKECMQKALSWLE